MQPISMLNRSNLQPCFADRRWCLQSILWGFACWQRCENWRTCSYVVWKRLLVSVCLLFRLLMLLGSLRFLGCLDSLFRNTSRLPSEILFIWLPSEFFYMTPKQGIHALTSMMRIAIFPLFPQNSETPLCFIKISPIFSFSLHFFA